MDDELAIHFPMGEDAEDALRAWTEERRALDSRRDPLVRGALAAGVRPTRIHQITGVSRATVDRIGPKPYAAIATGVQFPPVPQYLSILEARIAAIQEQPANDEADRAGWFARSSILSDALKALQEPSACGASEDADLQAHAARWHRAADEWAASESGTSRDRAPGAGVNRAMSTVGVQTYRQLATELTALRRFGDEVWTAGVFSAQDIAAGRARDEELNRNSLVMAFGEENAAGYLAGTWTPDPVHEDHPDATHEGEAAS